MIISKRTEYDFLGSEQRFIFCFERILHGCMQLSKLIKLNKISVLYDVNYTSLN